MFNDLLAATTGFEGLPPLHLHLPRLLLDMIVEHPDLRALTEFAENGGFILFQTVLFPDTVIQNSKVLIAFTSPVFDPSSLPA